MIMNRVLVASTTAITAVPETVDRFDGLRRGSDDSGKSFFDTATSEGGVRV